MWRFRETELLQALSAPNNRNHNVLSGPALLFSRFDQSSGTERKFFACSAFRDRKACPFFHWVDQTKGKTGEDHEKQCLKIPDLWPTRSHQKMRKR